MNYWYAPLGDLQSPATPRLPPELIAAVAAPWRSTTELAVIREKAKKHAHYDMANAAHSILQSRQKKDSKDAIRGLQHVQRQQVREHDDAAKEALSAVEAIWAHHVDHLRRQTTMQMAMLKDKHADALTKLREDQVKKADEAGIRPKRRNVELLHLRRSESVLAAKQHFNAAFMVKAHADDLAEEETRGAHADWLLRCHAEQERVAAGYRREEEVIQKRLETQLRDMEAARDRDLQNLERKIKVATAQQRNSFIRELQHMRAALGGCFLNTRTTRQGRGLADAFPTLSRLLAPPEEAAGSRASSAPRSSVPRPPGSHPGSGYLLPSSKSEDMGAVHEGLGKKPANQSEPAHAVRFAPTPPKEAWAAGSEMGRASAQGSEGSGHAAHSGTPASSAPGSVSGRSSRSSASTSNSSRTGASSVSGDSARPGSAHSSRTTSSGSGRSVMSGDIAVRGSTQGRPSSAALSDRGVAGVAGVGAAGGGEGTGAAAPPSTTVEGSGTTAAGTGSGSSALTEEALKAINAAAGGPAAAAARGVTSQNSSSFKSNKPYAGGLPAQRVARPISAMDRK